MVNLTLLTNRSGDFELHTTGCADIKRASRRHPERTTTHEGSSLVDALIAVDTDAAGWFGEEPYTESSRAAGCWAVANGIVPSPCVSKLIKRDGITFEPVTRRPVAQTR